MKNKKAISTLILLIIVLLATSILSVFALTNPTVYVASDEIVAGQEVSIPIAINNNDGLMGFRINVDYDATVLTPKSVTYGDVFQSGLQDNIDGDAKEGNFCVYWAGSESVSSNGILFYATFKVSELAVGKTELKLSYSQSDTFDENFNDVALTCENKTFNIVNLTLKTYAKLNVSANDAVAGENIVLTISPNEIVGVSTADLNIKYNTDVLDYVSTTSGTFNDNNGILSLYNFDVLKPVQITFKSRETATKGKYDFEITSTKDNVFCNNCSFEINRAPSSIEGITKLVVENSYSELGDKVRIPVRIMDNNGIMGYRLTFSYDNEFLANPVVEKGDAFEGTLNDSIGNSDSMFDVVWSNFENTYKNDVMFYIVFECVKLGATDIDVNYSQVDTFNENYEDVKLDCVNGSVTICQGHYYKYIGKVNSSKMDYVCIHCKHQISLDADDVYSNWCNYIVNTIPTNKTSIIDVNYDGIINAKDYAMIRNSQKLK